MPETLLGHLNDDGTVSGGIPIPGLASWLSDPSTGKATVVQGLDTVPADERPTTRQVNTVHLAWDVMVGLGTFLLLLALWYGRAWLFRRDMPRSKLFLRVARRRGVLSVITMEAGWVVSEVGRQPWIVYEQMKVEDAATGNTGVWITFVVVVLLYVGARRHHHPRAAAHEPSLPGAEERLRRRPTCRTGRPSHPSRAPRADEVPVAMSTAAAIVLFIGVTAYALFGGADFGAGFWDLTAGGHGARRAARGGHRPLHRPGLGGEPRLAHLLSSSSCGPASRRPTPRSRSRCSSRSTIAAFGIVLRGASFAFRKAVLRTRDRRRFGAVFAVSSVIVPYCMGAVAGAIASGRVPAGGEAGDPWASWVNPTSILGGVLAVCVAAYLAAVYLVWDAPAAVRRRHRRVLPHRRLSPPRRGRRRSRSSGVFVLDADAEYLFDGLTSRALPLVLVSGLRGRVLAAPAPPVEPPGRPALAAIVAVAAVVAAWGVAQWDYLLPESLTVADAAAPNGTITAVLVATGLAVVLIFPVVGPALPPRPDGPAPGGGCGGRGLAPQRDLTRPVHVLVAQGDVEHRADGEADAEPGRDVEGVVGPDVHPPERPPGPPPPRAGWPSGGAATG